jgi:hypothetical protein
MIRPIKRIAFRPKEARITRTNTTRKKVPIREGRGGGVGRYRGEGAAD